MQIDGLQLESALAAPGTADVEVLKRTAGDWIILGAGGKMGPSLGRRIRFTFEAANSGRRVIAVSRISPKSAREHLEAVGFETIACDLLDRQRADRLPGAENVFVLVDRKFGSEERPDLNWRATQSLPLIFEVDQVPRAYPHLCSDEFVSEHRGRGLC